MALQRAIRVFDFEEASERLVEFPDNFYRRSSQQIASAEGFPQFGTMHLSDDEASSGSWSFKFELDGGSMAAQTFNGALPILPGVDYAVSVQVRTAGLEHARARLAAWYHDAHGRVVPGSRVESSLIRTDGAWDDIAVELPSDSDTATDLIIELQALQPSQFLNADEQADQPVFEDVTGSVWFDEVKVFHLPRAELQMVQPDNVIRLPDTPRLSVLIRDHANAPLSSHLQVFDLDGRTIFDETYGPSWGQQRRIFTLPISTGGWYRALLEMRSDDRLTGRRWLDFAVLPEENRTHRATRNRFGIVLPEQSLSRLEVAPDLVRHLLSGSVVMPIWTRTTTRDGHTESYRRLRQVIANLLANDIDVTFSLNQLPDELAAELGLDPDQVMDMFSKDPDLWRTHLETLLVNFGLEVRRWQIGATGSRVHVARDDLGAQVEVTNRSLGRFVADPEIIIPWPAEYATPGDPEVDSLHISVPYQIQPQSLPEYADAWRGQASRLITTFEVLDETRFNPRQQITDLMLRTLHGWRAGLDLMNIESPWTWSRQQGDQLAVTPIYPVWRTLADRLNRRTFGGELFAENGLHCWILQGQAPDESALAVWSDQYLGDRQPALRLFLGTKPIQTVDAFGNVETIQVEDGLHTVIPGEMPIFVENINLELARFRSGFAIESEYIQAANRTHQHSIVVHNPWNVPISGEITLLDTQDLEVSPRSLPFTLRPGVEAKLPVQVVVGRNVLMGRKRIQAQATINADREYEINLQATAEVGLPNVRFSASWSQARNVITGTTDLVVSQMVTNIGDTVLNLDVFIMAEHLSVHRRQLPPLSPGESVTRMFNLGRTDSVITARQIRVGVEERSGAARLNRLLAIPLSEDASSQVGVVPD